MGNKAFSKVQWMICGCAALAITAQTAGTVAPYTTAMITNYVAGLEDNPYVFPTASSNENFVLGQSHGWASNPTVPKQDLFGFLVTDSASQQKQTRVVLISGNHNTEYSGNWALQGMIDFLIGDDARAAQLREKAEIFVYPMVNPDGRYLMTGRGNPELNSLGYSDHNRVWNKTGISTIDAFTAAIKRDTGGTTDYFFDFHDNADANYLLTKYTTSSFCKALKKRESGIYILYDSGVQGMARLWATSSSGLSSDYAFTPEFTSTQSAAYYQAKGQSYALALYDALIPEPAMTALMMLGGLVLVLRRRRNSSN
jgi:hypothetical protein